MLNPSNPQMKGNSGEALLDGQKQADIKEQVNKGGQTEPESKGDRKRDSDNESAERTSMKDIKESHKQEGKEE